jgi:eight-cysteine-cluster-containing protein
MRCFGVLTCLALVVCACSDYSGEIKEWKAPVLSKDWNTVVELRESVDFGNQVSGVFSTEKALTGFVFDAHRGARVTVTLDATNGDDPVLLLYGPLNDKGIWGGDGEYIALDHDSKDGRNSVISDFALPLDGRYLIGADTRDGSEGGPLQLSMGCRGECDEPRCDDETLLCDLYCPNGFMTDPSGCPLCRCVEECQTDEDCRLSWSDQIARCVDGQCIYEELACDSDSECPEGFICEIVCAGGGASCDPDNSDCRPDDTCDSSTGECSDWAPQECFGRCMPMPEPGCQSDADCPPGHVCLMECHTFDCNPTTGECPSDCDSSTGECPAFCEGRCVPEAVECQSDADCPEGFVCEMSCWDCDSGFPDCVGGCEGHCVPAPMPECDENTPCPPGFECVMECWEAGCDPETGVCPPGCDPATGDQCEPVCRGYCVPVSECRNDRDCSMPGGEAGRCIDGRCVYDNFECEADSDCPPGMRCDIYCGNGWCRGVCVPVEPECFEDSDCIDDAGNIMGRCINGQCVYDEIYCDDATPCPEGMECVMVCGGPACDSGDPDCPPEECYGYCVPVEPQCRVDTDCIDDAGNMGRCVDGHCVFEQIYCHSDWECPPGYECEFVGCLPDCDTSDGAPTDPDCCIGICVPSQEPECRTDEDCVLEGPDGDLGNSDGDLTRGRCIDGRCVYDDCNCPDIYAPVCAEKCFTDPNCDEIGGNPCDYLCELITYSNDCYAECDGARIVHPGTCEDEPTRCSNNAECPPGMYCELDNSDVGAGICMPLPNMECQTDTDCPEGFRCEIFTSEDEDCWPGEPCSGGQSMWGRCVPIDGDCIVTGCSGEVCAPFPVDTTCVWLPEYECLRLTTCELLQSSDGRQTCGWMQTPEYLECLDNNDNADECNTDMDCPPGMGCQTFCGNGWCESRCYQMDCVCPELLDPVCGPDGTAYDNICYANCAGVEAFPCEDDDTRP